MPCESAQETGGQRLRARQRCAVHERKRECVETARSWPSPGIVEDCGGIHCRHCLHQTAKRIVPSLAGASRSRDFTNKSVEAHGLGYDRWVTLVCDRFAINKGEGAQRCHRFFQTIVGKRGRQRLAEFLTRLGKQEQRDRLWRQQRGVDDQRLGSGGELRRLL